VIPDKQLRPSKVQVSNVLKSLLLLFMNGGRTGVKKV